MQSDSTSEKLSGTRNIIAITISDLVEDIHFRDAYVRLDIRSLDFRKLINLALIIYNNEGYNVDHFTLRRFLRDRLDRHCLDYLIYKESLKPQMRDVETVIQKILDLFKDINLSTYKESECYYYSRTTLYIKGYE